MKRRFAILDVFTDQSMTGNQLAVVYESDGLDTEVMQKIAAEFNFPETVFVSPALQDGHSAAVRIFTPKRELPFAGHPTVGAAIAIAREKGMEQVGQGIVVLEENVGPVRCGVRFDETGSYAEFDLPVLPKREIPPNSKKKVALALGLEVGDLGFENHVISAFDAGVPFVMVPVKNLEAIGRAKANNTLWRDGFGELPGNSAYLYCRETVGHDNHFHARMFAPDFGIIEDPATGSAVAGFAGAVALLDKLPDGAHALKIEQGVEMGRPSLIALEIDMLDGEMKAGRIGGYATEFARGSIEA